MPELIKTSQGIQIQVWVQPRSSRNMLAGVHGDSFKLKLTAPPVGGQANALCLKYLAKQLAWPRTALEITAGHSSRTKHILIRCNEDECNKLEQRIQMLFVKKSA